MQAPLQRGDFTPVPVPIVQPQIISSIPSPKPKRSRPKDPEAVGKVVPELNVYESHGYQTLKQVMKEPITVSALISLAYIFCAYLGQHLPRDCLRKKELLIKWFDDHLYEWIPLIPRIRFEYETVHDTRDNIGTNVTPTMNTPPAMGGFVMPNL